MTEIALDETPAEEFSRLVIEYNEGNGSEREEAWNLIADFALEHCDAILRGLRVSPSQVAPANPAQVTELHGPFGWLNGHRALSEDSWTLESDPLENSEEYFAIPLYALTDPFKEIGKDFDGTLTAAIGAGGQAVKQFRKVGCADWYDGLPDNADGRGPYETRVLYIHPADERVVEALWSPLTHKDDKMTCPMPADETVVEVMLQDGTVCPAWYSCNIMEAGDWDFLPVKDDGEPDDEADSIASRIVAWRALSTKEGR